MKFLIPLPPKKHLSFNILTYEMPHSAGGPAAVKKLTDAKIDDVKYFAHTQSTNSKKPAAFDYSSPMLYMLIHYAAF